MGVIRVRHSARIAQPQDGSPLNLSNSLARGIVAAYSFAEKGRNLTGDADLDGTIVGSMSYGPGGAGIGLVGAYQASNNYLSVPRTSKLAYTTQVTFEALVRLKSPQTTAFPYLSGIIGQYQSNSGGTSSYYGPYLRLNSDASSGNARQSVFSVLQGGVEHQITGPDLADGQLTYIIGTYDGSRIALFVNGVKYSASLTGAFDNDASNFISIGSEYVASSPAFSNNRCFNGDIYWAAIRDVGLTDAEGIALSGSLNPWQLFEPSSIYLPTSSGGLIMRRLRHSVRTTQPRW